MTKPADVTSKIEGRVSSEAHSMTELLEIQRAAFLRDGIPDAATRIDRITRLSSLLLDHGDEIAEALTVDFGSRPRELSIAADVAGCMIDLTHQRRGVKEWMADSVSARVQEPSASSSGCGTIRWAWSASWAPGISRCS